MKHQEYKGLSWRRVLRAVAAVSFIGGFFAPHQWAITAICLSCIWAEKSQTKKEEMLYGE